MIKIKAVCQFCGNVIKGKNYRYTTDKETLKELKVCLDCFNEIAS